jgi:UDP-2-acetamido-2-deoxy-ribo-hexuluronate aminotransferase
MPARTGEIPFHDLKTQYQALQDSIDLRIRRVLEHGQFIMGPEVKELEQKLAAYTGAAHCVAVASGTEALLISLMAIGVRPGDEVITTPFTFVATAETIALLGAVPVFVDIEPDTCNINADLIEAAVTPRTRAIMPVSLYGQPADMDEINAVAARHGNIPVIEDAAQSFGAVYKGRKSCNLSMIGCTSFFPTKPLGCYGDGGAIFTSDESIAQACREIRVHGQRERYVHTRVGVGGRMDTLQCAIVLAKLERFEAEVERRLAIGKRYNERLDAAGIRRVHQRSDRNSVFAQYTVFCDDRERVRRILMEHGVPTAVHYPMPLSDQPGYRGIVLAGALPVVANAVRLVLSLPMHADLDEATQNVVVTRVVEAFRVSRIQNGE